MRITFLLLFLPFFSAAQEKDSTFHLIAGFDVKTHVRNVTIEFQSGSYYVSDSMTRVGNHFEYKTTLSRSVIGKIKVHVVGINTDIRIFMEPGVLLLTALDSLYNYTVIGSKMQREFSELDKMLQPYARKKNRLGIARAMAGMKKDSLGEKKFEALRLHLDTTMKKDAYRKFIPEHWNSKIALYALREFSNEYFNPFEGERLFSELSAGVRTSKEGQAVMQWIERTKATAIGAIAPGFTQPDIKSKPVSLQSFRGKYVLVDFWASWCIPCRRENPYLVKAYKKYKKKGFEILSISLDDSTSRDDWMKAIKTDRMSWVHASDLKGWDNEASNLYLVESIPFNVLIDPEGRIVAKNLRGEELERKFAELVR